MCFKRRQKEETIKTFTPPPCDHKFRDFPWYIKSLFTYENSDNDIGSLKVEAIKPYVCIHCGYRKDVVVASTSTVRVKRDDADKMIDDFEEPYKDYIKPIGVVESEIHDMLLVDRAYLKIVDDLTAAKNAPSPFDTN